MDSIIYRGSIFRESQVLARSLSTDALLARADALRFDLASDEDEDDWLGDTGRYLAGERLRAVEAEIARRVRIVKLGKVPDQAVTYAQWRETARTIRERVEVPTVFAMGCYFLRPGGTNGRRGHAEYAGACPVCGGTDRLRVWGGANGRAWCRRCGWSADVLTVAQTLFQEGFRDAVRRLSPLAGVGR
jgi:hypothetical protein